MLQELLKKNNISMYRLAKNCKVPYSTINDIFNGKAQLEKCSVETIYKISKELNVSMEYLLEPCFTKRINFELFKSNVCHQLKELGDIEFIIRTLEEDEITKYNNFRWYPECLYMLGMLDYISNQNEIPLCDKYEKLRKCRLKDTLYPSSILAIHAATKDNNVLKEACDKAILEFMRFNIVENEVRNVI